MYFFGFIFYQSITFYTEILLITTLVIDVTVYLSTKVPYVERYVCSNEHDKVSSIN